MSNLIYEPNLNIGETWRRKTSCCVVSALLFAAHQRRGRMLQQLMLICSSAYAPGISCLLVAFLRVILDALNPDSKKKLILLLWFIIIDQSANNTFLLLALCTAIAGVTNLFLFLSAGKNCGSRSANALSLWAALPTQVNPSEVTGIIHVHKTVPPGTRTIVYSSAWKFLILPFPYGTHL